MPWRWERLPTPVSWPRKFRGLYRKSQTWLFGVMGSQRVRHDWAAFTFFSPSWHKGLPWWLSGKDLPAMQEAWVLSLGWEDSLEKGITTHSGVLAWRISWTAESGGLQFMGSQRAGHGWVKAEHFHFHVFGTIWSLVPYGHPLGVSTPWG